MTPCVSYKLDVPGTPAQGVAKADRPLCAAVQALRTHTNGAKLGGTCEDGNALALVNYLHQNNIPYTRVTRWIAGLNQQKHRPSQFPSLAGKTLDEYQCAAIRGLTVAGGVLALGCGLGKTITALAATLSYTVTTKRLWIVCPLNAMSSWKPYLPYLEGWDCRIISMDSLHKMAAEPVGGVVIYDECHLLKSSSARRARAAHACRLAFDVGICLTGTFLHGGIEGTLSMLDLAVPGAAGFSHRYSAGQYYKCLVRKRLGNRTVVAVEKPSGNNRTAFFDYLKRYVVMLSTASESVRASVAVPDQFLHTITLGAPWRDLTEEAAAIALTIHADTGVLPHAQEVAHELCKAGSADKIEWLLGHLTDDTEPVVVYAHYHETLDALCSALDSAGTAYVRVDGSTSAKDRLNARDAFAAGKARIFVGQVVASGIGVDGLQSVAKLSVSIDHCWRPDVYAQALARTARRGQTEETHHFDLVANRLQERVVERLRMGSEFNAEAEEWLQIKQQISTCNLPSTNIIPLHTSAEPDSSTGLE